jgi:hypothetical protein
MTRPEIDARIDLLVGRKKATRRYVSMRKLNDQGKRVSTE